IQPRSSDMNLKEKYLCHQIHPLKLFTEIGAGIGSLFPLWHHQLAFAIVVMLAPPLLVSFLLSGGHEHGESFPIRRKLRAEYFWIGEEILRRNARRRGERGRNAEDDEEQRAEWGHWISRKSVLPPSLNWSGGDGRSVGKSFVGQMWVSAVAACCWAF